MKTARFGLFAVLFFAALGSLCAQVQVDIAFKRTLYMKYEPMICRVTITNMSGRTLELSDTKKDRWFAFQIQTPDGRPIAPRSLDYSNEPVVLEAGKKLVRSINLTPMFPFEFGTYRVQATVYSEQLGRYFTSPRLNVEVTEGRKVYEETVGVPAGTGSGNTRTFEVLVFRLTQTTMLYVRVLDPDTGTIYCTTPLGRYLAFGSPEVQFDAANNIHILQNAAPKTYLHSQVDINGKVVGQQALQVGKVKPGLTRKPDGTIVAVGGVPYDPKATPPEKSLPKLSDRPVPLPGPQGKSTPEDERPKNLLSE